MKNLLLKSTTYEDVIKIKKSHEYDSVKLTQFKRLK